MKRAWVSIVEWEGRSVGQIERISALEDWPIYCVNNGWVVPLDFDDTNIASGYELAELIPEYWSKEYEDDVLVDPQDESWAYHVAAWQIVEDTARKEADAVTRLENAKLDWEKACYDGGEHAKVHFNRLLSRYNYGDTEQEFFMNNSEFQLVDYFLSRGAINKSIALLTSKAVESYYTQSFKDDFIAILTDITTTIGNEPQ